MGVTDVQDAWMRAKPAIRDTWQGRWIAACAELPRGDRIFNLMLLCAIDAKASGGARYPAFGDNALIKADRTVWTRYTNKDAYTTVNAVQLCTVDQLNKYLGWMMEAIHATDAEYTEIVNRVATWISRDETQIGLHVERQRAAVEAGKDEDLTPVFDELREKGKL